MPEGQRVTGLGGVFFKAGKKGLAERAERCGSTVDDRLKVQHPPSEVSSTQQARAPSESLLQSLQWRRGALPTIAKIGPYRFFFYSNEGTEPPHVHVQHESSIAKYWLSPVALAASGGFAAVELRTLEGLVEEHRKEFMEAWNEFFGGRDKR